MWFSVILLFFLIVLVGIFLLFPEDSNMTFNDVYQALLHMFPRIDPRVLRVIAIENKDLDAAFQAVHDEVPHLYSKAFEDRECDTNRAIEEFLRDRDHYHVRKFSEKARENWINLINGKSNDEPVVTARRLERNSRLLEVPMEYESVSEKSEVSLSTDTTSNLKSKRNFVGKRDDSTSNATMSQSSQCLCVLDEVIANAGNNKIILYSRLASVIGLMREVELKEQAAKQAKKEAPRGCLNILKKVYELDQILKHANVVNQTHAGEVYSENASLPPEVRLLHTRVFNMSNGRDKSLQLLDEMRRTLESRLAVAENEIKAAAQEKLDLELAAQILLHNRESVMKKAMQESKILGQKTDDNLKKLLVDCACAVNKLEGELIVIRDDVSLLKGNLDETGSFTKTLSSGMISFVKPPSNSSLKGRIPYKKEPVPVQDDSLETQNGTDHEKISEVEASGDDHNTFLNDGWDFLDNHETEA